MKKLLCFIVITCLSTTGFAQTRSLYGTVTDSLKRPLPGVIVRLITGTNDTIPTHTDTAGRFSFRGVGSAKLSLSFSAVGFQGLIRHYSLDTGRVSAGTIVLKEDWMMLNDVTVSSTRPIVFKEDTIEYRASAYPVRENAPVEDLIRRLPGVEVDAQGNITAQGKQVTKVRVNGKDFFSGDVQTATRNLPADIVESIQVIDDYGDQANLTGVKTGDPTKIMNITIKPSRNHGFTGQFTGGDGVDMLPAAPGVVNNNRHVGLLSDFYFNGDQQISLLANVNNTNVNTFSFGTPANPPSGGGAILNKKISAEKLAAMSGKTINTGGGNFSNQAAGVNGITNTHTAGLNFRDQWSKKLSVYGSYSLSDNTTFTQTSVLQLNTTPTIPGTTSQDTKDTARNINHRLQWNMEWKPNDVDYLKFTTTGSFARTDDNQVNQTNAMAKGVVTNAFTMQSQSKVTTPGIGFTVLYNHRFAKAGRNLSINFNFDANTSTATQNPSYQFITGTATAPINQQILTDNQSHSVSATLTYLEPLGSKSYLELNYDWSNSFTDNNRQTNVWDSLLQHYAKDTSFSNQYQYSFITNRFGLYYHNVLKGKYNFTIGLGLQPTVLDGHSPMTSVITHHSSLQIVPTAHLTYTLSKSETLGLNYSGRSAQPGFLQLQPVTDFSNALYPVQGNPDLKPSFTQTFSFSYNKFSSESGRTLFSNLSFTQVSDQIVTQTTIYPARYGPQPQLSGTYLTTYNNANGYYNASGFISYGMPWANRRFSLLLNGSINYTHNVGYLTSIDTTTYSKTTQQNTVGNLLLTPGVRFRIDLPDHLDFQLLANYNINNTVNSIQNDFTNATANIRSWNFSLSAKHYFHDWTISYDVSKIINQGYAASVHATNPGLVNAYVERRFGKKHALAARLAIFDLLNQNTGFSTSATSAYITQTNVNRLGRYGLLSLTWRFQRFAK